MNETQSPVLVPPSDMALRKRLELKLAEYQARKDGKGMPWEFDHPLILMRSEGYRDSYYKVEILTAVLAATEPVKTQDLALALVQKLTALDEQLDVRTFENACGTIDLYLTEGDQMGLFVQGGTGLPPLPETVVPAEA